MACCARVLYPCMCIGVRARELSNHRGAQLQSIAHETAMQIVRDFKRTRMQCAHTHVQQATTLVLPSFKCSFSSGEGEIYRSKLRTLRGIQSKCRALASTCEARGTNTPVSSARRSSNHACQQSSTINIALGGADGHSKASLDAHAWIEHTRASCQGRAPN